MEDQKEKEIEIREDRLLISGCLSGIGISIMVFSLAPPSLTITEGWAAGIALIAAGLIVFALRNK